MKLVELKAHDFRNLQSLSLTFHPRANYFFGANGQGKTNLLEAIAFVLSGESFRTNNLEPLIKKMDDASEVSAQLKAVVEKSELRTDVEASLLPSAKRISVNGKRVSRGSLEANFPVIVFSPESLSAIKEGPELRRQLMNELVKSHRPDNQALIAEYLHALKTRNRILRDIHKRVTSEIQGTRMLESLNRSFYSLGAELIFQRLEAIRGFKSIFLETAHTILRTDVEISVEYVSSHDFEGKNPFEIFDALQQRATQLRPAEIASGTSLVGPHKHDLRILFNGNDARFFCSQGQQRALILAFKIGQIVYHRQVQKSCPILVLDDVLSELDSDRRRYLIEFLKNSDSQTFLTSTDLPTELSETDRQDIFVFEVSEGRIRFQKGY